MSPESSALELPRIGIVGGMGPLASAEFNLELVRATPATCDQQHFPTTLDSTPQVPDRQRAAQPGGPDPLPCLVGVLRRLEAAGCALIALPCNSVHHWYTEIAAQTSLPVLHIADAVAAQLRAQEDHVRRVGVLATALTSRQGIYEKRLGDEWQWVYACDETLEQWLMPGVAAVKRGDLAQGRHYFLRAAQDLLAQQVDALVLGCTEIPVVLRQADFSIPVINSTQALAAHTVAIASGLVRR